MPVRLDPKSQLSLEEFSELLQSPEMPLRPEIIDDKGKWLCANATPRWFPSFLELSPVSPSQAPITKPVSRRINWSLQWRTAGRYSRQTNGLP
jgi:hypothetical protein